MEGKQHRRLISVGHAGGELLYACNSLPIWFSWRRDICSILTGMRDASALAEGQQSFQGRNRLWRQILGHSYRFQAIIRLPQSRSLPSRTTPHICSILFSKEKISTAAAGKDKFKKENERDMVAHG
jgi:hypothetical protein